MVKEAGNQQPMPSGMYLSLKVGQLDPLIVLEEISVGLLQVVKLDVIILIMYPTMNGGIITKDGKNLILLMISSSNVLKVSTPTLLQCQERLNLL